MSQLLLDIPLSFRRKKLGVSHRAGDWPLSSLFGKFISEYCLYSVLMTDFEMDHYVYFLDHVTTREELVKGLEELSPFADDALLIADWMNDQEFLEFSEILPLYRESVRSGREDVSMPEKYDALLLPELLLHALRVAPEASVSLGVALIRLWEVIYSKERRKLKRAPK
jgi:hypothetical protein